MGLFTAFIIAMMVALLFAPGYRKGSYFPLAVFFVILFLGALAGRYWIVPFGPEMWGVAWLPILFVTLIFAFLISSPTPIGRLSSIEKARKIESASTTINVFVWLLMFVLTTAVIVGYAKL